MNIDREKIAELLQSGELAVNAIGPVGAMLQAASNHQHQGGNICGQQVDAVLRGYEHVLEDKDTTYVLALLVHTVAEAADLTARVAAYANVFGEIPDELPEHDWEGAAESVFVGLMAMMLEGSE